MDKPSPSEIAKLSVAAMQLHRAGRLDEAERIYRRVLAADRENADALHLLGVIALQKGQADTAIDLIGQAIARNREFAPFHLNLARALVARGRRDEAVAAYGEAIALNPADPESHFRLGNLFFALSRIAEAASSFLRATVVKPDWSEAQFSLGVALEAMNRPREAAEAYRRAIALKPDYVEAQVNLGSVLAQQKRLVESAAAYRQALAIRPDDDFARVGLSHQLRLLCDWSEQAAFDDDVHRAIQKGVRVPPFHLFALPSSPAEQLACARNWVNGFGAVPRFESYPAVPAADGRIRVGYLSDNFREHASAHLFAELIERHDRARFETFAYSFGPDDGSPMRARLVRSFEHFVEIGPLSIQATARHIHADGIAILVDLKGHTARGRTQALAYRPAPIQINYLGYPATMGADFIDYIVADPVVIPRAEQSFYAERLVHLPGCYQANDTRREVTEATPSRQDCGLPEAGFVFCCFNNSYKLTPGFFDIWMRLLAAVPGSVLWLLEASTDEPAANEQVRDNLRREAAARGVDPGRLVFAPRLPFAAHMARHRQADLFLDTLPCNAHTTASDALWAGLPVLTCRGNTFAGRVAASALTAAGLPELVTESLADYEAMALRLATRPDDLARLRETLAKNRATAPLFDAARKARDLEAAYQIMWDRWRAGLGPEGFAVEGEAPGL